MTFLNFKTAAVMGLMVTVSTIVSATAARAATDMPIDSVILSTSGLVNVSRHAHVTGDAKVTFPVRLEQVDDVLKSLVIFDKKGTLGGVTLPGKQPLSQVFKDLPFTRQQMKNPMLLLNAYQGANITLRDKSGSSISGKVLQVEEEQVDIGDQKTVAKHRISVMTDTGIKQAVLEDLQSIQFSDAKVQGEITRALEAIRDSGTAESRTLTVSLMGQGERDVTLSYVVDAPLWKTAYRLVLPDMANKAQAGKGFLQGWAVIENTSATDWNNVDLTLVSGNPVTFRQALYQSYFVDRPEVPVEVFGRVMPRVDEGVVASADKMQRRAEEALQQDGAPLRQRALKGAVAPVAPMAMGMVAAAPAMAANEMAADSAESDDAGATDMASIAGAANAAQSAEATTQVLFRFKDRFSLKAGDSMMVPFISREVPMTAVSLYQPDVQAKHPLAAVEIKNEAGTGLPPGVLTIYEENPLIKGTGFVGDARMTMLAPGEKRLVSYAVDSKTDIDRSDKSETTEGKIAIDGGVMRTAIKQRNETVYTIKAPEKEARTVVIEHPRMGADYKIVSPDPKDVEVTDGYYRIKADLAAGETKTLDVVLESTSWQSYQIISMPSDLLAAYAQTKGALDDATRRVFDHLAKARREIDEIDRRIADLDQQRETIFEDQARVRENIKSLNGGKSDVGEKYLKKLSDQEDKIAEIDASKQKLADLRAKKETDLGRQIADIKI